jgi:hypothetical protein
MAFHLLPINLVCNFEQTGAETLRILAGSSIQTGTSGQTVSRPGRQNRSNGGRGAGESGGQRPADG